MQRNGNGVYIVSLLTFLWCVCVVRVTRGWAFYVNLALLSCFSQFFRVRNVCRRIRHNLVFKIMKNEIKHQRISHGPQNSQVGLCTCIHRVVRGGAEYRNIVHHVFGDQKSVITSCLQIWCKSAKKTRQNFAMSRAFLKRFNPKHIFCNANTKAGGINELKSLSLVKKL